MTGPNVLCPRLTLLVMYLVCAAWLGVPAVARAQSGRCSDWAAKIVSVEGRVEARRAGDSEWKPAKLNETFCPNDQVRTLEDSRAAIQLQGETVLRLDQSSMVRFSALKPESSTLLQLLKGSAFFMSRFPRPLTIETPYVNATSGGTEYHIEVNEKDHTATITVIEGKMNVSNEAGSVTVEGGQAAVIQQGRQPVLRLRVRVQDVVQWAVYYPPVLSMHDLGLSAIQEGPAGSWQDMVRRSAAAYRDGRIEQAFTALKGAPADIADARFYVYRASVLLAVGRVDEAKADLDKAYDLAPRGGLALALQAIIAVAQSRPAQALTLASQAADAQPDAISVLIAQSYAEQASFNLPAALAAARKAVRIDPSASLAWARLAELWMGRGNLDKALEAAREAETINPKEVRAQTVLGFSYLTRINIAGAKNAFSAAIALNPADPLPRLGLGLAMIRIGDLALGRKQIEIAAALDPLNSLIRSYLGKAYYEEKRNKRAGVQFQLAEKLDPKDPTPYTYDAVREQTVNRPVEALRDMQTAIDLNDNRAVYRSRLLLDSDLASRSVRRGRIYENLGFDQLAVIDALLSVNSDPMNYSAQRFLADSYATLSHSEIARQSALLTSQLLQPINNNPVQPSLTNDSVLAAGRGSLNPSFNEYSQLFNSNGTRLLATGMAGQQGTGADEVIVNGVYGPFSWSLGQFHYKTDGFRDNAGIDQNIYNAFMQGQVTTKLSVQGEVRLNQEDHGYLSLYYDPAIYSPTYNKDQTSRTYRLGVHYALTPTSSVLLSVFYLHHTEKTTDNTKVDVPVPGFGLSTSADQRQRMFETQYIVRLGMASLITGAGYYRASQGGTINTYITLPGLGQVPLSTIPVPDRIRHANLYLYSLLNVFDGLHLSIGGSVDRVQDQTLGNHTQFNPKLGITWDITPATTLRVAGLRVLNRDIVSNQTIEPTQVAGFQQFFEDTVAADSRLYGVGLNHKFATKMFGGLQFTKRDVRIPQINTATNSVNHYTIKYQRGRAYLYWTPNNSIALSADYFYQRTDSTSPDAETTTQRVPLGIKYFHPSGFFAGMTVSYVAQSGTYDNPVTKTADPVSSQFGLVDVSVGYRFPRRLGILSVGVRNLTDRQFRLNEVDPQFVDENQLAPLQPRRFLFAKLTLSYY